ncbi:MAG: efflux RND transporter periplasmic adaptor subunit [Oleispira sp.]|nr:efflux RND transporter periplasmic adaptor subunit [Oleispira sp.]MBL4882351.1 efflux RND transporter periplasmic adaptor subunit [Oleispira sp.]
MKKSQPIISRLLLALMFTAGLSTAYASESHDEEIHEQEENGQNAHGHKHGEHENDHEEGTTISAYFIQASGIKSETAGPQTLIQTDTLFGVITPVQDQVFSLHASFPSMVNKVFVQVGDRVKEGQSLARLTNILTLQSYTLKSPSAGEVTSRSVNTGDRVDAEEILVISDLSKVWVDMSAFPENVERLKVGQRAKVYDLHDHEKSMGEISYIAPQMTGGHIARARAIIDNSAGHWRPGMHVKADIEIGNKPVALAVKVNALQNMENNTVVFERDGNNFTVRAIEVGEKDDQWVEIVSGLESGAEYVSENSFLLKADILKSGASHDH